MTAKAIPDEALFFVADRYYSRNEILTFLYTNPSSATAEHFNAVNIHFKDGWVTPGQMVIVTPPEPSACSKWEAIMMAAAARVDEEIAAMSERARRDLARNYALISNAAGYSGTMYGWTGMYFDQKKRHVERVLKRIEALYSKTYNQTGSLNHSGFFTQRRALFLQLDQTINGMLERRLFGQDVNANRIKA